MPTEDGMPYEVLMYAADQAILHGKPQILEAYRLVVVPDTFRLYTKECQEVIVYTYPDLEAVDVDQVVDDE